ncbi:UDP-N-acetylmuramoyl-L-alanine--D-glutamate ligase [Carnobacteriaceae bacterium zg-ZUI78]|nr:UDP-N-acetylmuramoyl-L-alanine--D-glutamate ligase [Carnobacteriaceae bacterium zg-ZUI78]
MKQIDDFKGKHVLVLGLAKSGYHAALLLHELGAHVIVNDGKIPEDLTDVHTLQDLNIHVVLGEHPLDLVHGKLDYMVKNPGISYENSLVKKAIDLDIPVLTDVELAFRVSKAAIIGVTGSNGKTTTTTLIGNMLEKNVKGHTYIAGNIGIPSTTVAKQTTENDVIVMELSSFQLMGVTTFRPKIAIITNIYEAHLDYHGSREAYKEAKLHLIKQQTIDDYLILNGDLAEMKDIASTSNAQVLYFSKTDDTADAYVKNGNIFVLGEPIMSVSDIQVPGTHNIENVLAASLAARLYGQSKELIQQAVQQFHGVKHRTQFIGNVNGRQFYNDSKATNILATKMALQGFNDKVILIAGGLDRGNGFETLEPSLEKVKTLVLYGETKEKLKLAGEHKKVEKIILVDTLEQAVNTSYTLSQVGDTILFSPACASWDQFPSFEVRGDVFIDCVSRLNQQ